jgi:ethanolamine transporter EutH
VQRETTFRLGGGILIGLGLVLAGALAWAGAGLTYLDAWLAAAFSAVIGAFFLHVAGDVARFRAEYLRAAEEGRPPPPGGPPL